MQSICITMKCNNCKQSNVGTLTVPPSWDGSDVLIKCSLCEQSHEVSLTYYPVKEVTNG